MAPPPPRDARSPFWDGADLAACLGLAEMGDHQFRLARPDAWAAAYGVPTTGPYEDGHYDVYVLYVRTGRPDLPPRVGA